MHRNLSFGSQKRNSAVFQTLTSTQPSKIRCAPYKMRSYFSHELFGSFGYAKMPPKQPIGLFNPLCLTLLGISPFQGAQDGCGAGRKKAPHSHGNTALKKRGKLLPSHSSLLTRSNISYLTIFYLADSVTPQSAYTPNTRARVRRARCGTSRTL